MEEPPEKTEPVRDRKRISGILLLCVALVFAATSLVIGEYEGALVSVPTVAVVAIILLRNGRFYVPPALIIILAAGLAMFMVAKYSTRISNGIIFELAADFTMGVFLALIGLIVVYTMLESMPDFDRKHAFFVSLCAFCIGLSLSILVLLLNYTLTSVRDSWDIGYDSTFVAVREIVMVVVGSGFISVLFYLNRHNGLFRHTLEKFLSENAGTLGIEDRDVYEIMKIIETGETSTTEFKSTLRTNLATGEKDPRMEKAVLKTIVAFLNSRGGTLLIGVADDGTVIGTDESSFESRDKMMLHLNNLIKSQIGGEFLPFITYRAHTVDGKTVIRVDCGRSDSPVFLREGKTETFFVRSGPSSIDLHGTDMLAYANHNFGSQLKKIYNKLR